MRHRQLVGPATRVAFIGNAQRLTGRLPAKLGRGIREVGKIALNYRGDRRTAVRHLHYAIARRVAPIVVAPFGQARLFVDLRDEEIGRVVFLTGGYERWHMEAALKHLHDEGWETLGRDFLDVGANIGTSTVDALVHFGFQRAVCFEPQPDNVRLLRLNLVLNDLEDRVEVHPVALSHRSGAALLLSSPDNFGDQRVGEVADAAPPPAASEDLWVDCRPLDVFVEDGAIDPGRVGLLWIDAQGHEAHILDGARKLLEVAVPAVVEYCPWLLLDAVADLEDQIGYHYRRIIDLHAAAAGDGDKTVVRPSDFPRLRSQYSSGGYTDLLLMP